MSDHDDWGEMRALVLASLERHEQALGKMNETCPLRHEKVNRRITAIEIKNTALSIVASAVTAFAVVWLKLKG